MSFRRKPESSSFHRFWIPILIGVTVFSACGSPLDLKNDSKNDFRQTSFEDESATGTLKIVVFDVGEGSSTLVISPSGETAIIDTGSPGNWSNIIMPYLTANNLSVEHLFITHGDSDHVGGMTESKMFAEALVVGETFDLGGMSLDVLAKDCIFADGEKISCDESDDNAHSMVLLVSFGKFKYLIEGDLPGGGGNPPYQTIDLETKISELTGDIDILQVSHHGSNTSTNQNLLTNTKPEAAIISVGDSNPFWHPHQSTIERLVENGVKIYMTEKGWLKDEFLGDVTIKNGNIEIESDGDSYSIK